MTARLVELAVLLGQLGAGDAADADVVAFALADGEGLAAVQTARGLLLHRARVRDGRVADYQIVAPTEWNFHPDGPLARGLAGMAADDGDTLARRARLAVQALDPCVGCTIEVTHA
jgi:coenzyme F420-reducing hydrogenase alpha subunit